MTFPVLILALASSTPSVQPQPAPVSLRVGVGGLQAVGTAGLVTGGQLHVMLRFGAGELRATVDGVAAVTFGLAALGLVETTLRWHFDGRFSAGLGTIQGLGSFLPASIGLGSLPARGWGSPGLVTAFGPMLVPLALTLDPAGHHELSFTLAMPFVRESPWIVVAGASYAYVF